MQEFIKDEFTANCNQVAKSKYSHHQFNTHKYSCKGNFHISKRYYQGFVIPPHENREEEPKEDVIQTASTGVKITYDQYCPIWVLYNDLVILLQTRHFVLCFLVQIFRYKGPAVAWQVLEDQERDLQLHSGKIYPPNSFL